MQLLCNGVFLDLYENTNVQFTHDNPLFAFDDLKCERTTNFKLPATPTNDRVFALARIPAYAGDGMRRKFVAQLQAGAVVQNGYLYVLIFDGKDYNAVFVTGELVGLQVLKNVGKLPEWWPNTTSGIVWSAENVKDANTYDGQLSVALTRYKTNDTAPVHPSYDLGDLIAYAYNQLTGRKLTTYTRGFRLIPKELKPLPKMTANVTYTGTDVENVPNLEIPTNRANVMTIDAGGSIIGDRETFLYVREGGSGGGNSTLMLLKQFLAKQTLVLTFPSDFPDNYFLMSIEDKGVDGSNPEYNPLSPAWFLGDYSFHTVTDGGVVAEGTPLSGRSVEVPTGHPFIILSSDGYEYAPQPLYWNGFRWINQSTYTYELSFDINGKEVVPGDTIRMVELLPELTLIELLKMYTYLTGTMLMYDEANGISFDGLNFDSWPIVDVSGKITKESDVNRAFGKYAQNNFVRFESGDDVMKHQRIAIDYTIDNDNLEGSKDIATIPYSEGAPDVEDGYIVARFDAEDLEKHTLYADGIMLAKDCKYGERITLPKNANLQSLCDASTQYKISARQSLLEYNKIDAKKLILLDGIQYVWTSRNWQKDVGQYTLSKIGVAAAPDPILPLAYQQVEWIGTRDGARITLNHIQTLDTTIEVEAARFTGGSNAWSALYSGYNGVSNSGITLYFSTSNNYSLLVRDTAGLERQLTNMPDTREWHKYKQTPLEFYIDDEQKMTYKQGTVNGGNILFFYFLKGSRKWYGDATKITIKERDVITNELIPCYRKSDNVAGYYDITNKKFYTNDLGTGSLIAGPDVN